MKLSIVTWYNPILAQPAEAVTTFGPEIATLAEDMVQTMKAYNGLGLAGPQVAAGIRIFVIDREDVPLVAINPRLMIEGPDDVMNEGCLSLPGVYNQVTRGTKVTMQYQDVTGKENEIFLEALPARVAQHELDHINGIMFFDRLSRQMRKATLREWAKKGGTVGPK